MPSLWLPSRKTIGPDSGSTSSSAIQQVTVRHDQGTVTYIYFNTEPEGKFALGLVYASGGMRAATGPSVVSHFSPVVWDAPAVSAYWERLGFPSFPMQHATPRADSRYRGASLLSEAYRNSTPVTVHVAIGTDTPHIHPSASGDAIGRATHHDFRLLCSLVKDMNDGGIYLNVGSAVLLPEVFLKAISVIRNLGNPLANFTTANFDFLQHYRPRVNVVERPHSRSGGHGYSITGHHEIMIPLLAAALIESHP